MPSQRTDEGYQFVVPKDFGGYKTLGFNAVMMILAVVSYFNPEFNPPTQQTVGLLLDQIIVMAALVGNVYFRFKTDRPVFNRMRKEDKAALPDDNLEAPVEAPDLFRKPIIEEPDFQPVSVDLDDISIGDDPGTAVVPVQSDPVPDKGHTSIRDMIGAEALTRVSHFDKVSSLIRDIRTVMSESTLQEVIDVINPCLPLHLTKEYHSFDEFRLAVENVMSKTSDESLRETMDMLNIELQLQTPPGTEPIISTQLG